MENEDKKVSKFSSGLNIIMRIDILWKNCQNFKRNGRYSDWNDELDTIWLELARDIKPEDYKDKLDEQKKVISEGYESKFKQFDNQIKKFLPFDDSLTGFTKPSNDIYVRRNEQYKILMEKQLFLSRCENELNKGTTYEDEDDDF
jgi:hypothetical protein